MTSECGDSIATHAGPASGKPLRLAQSQVTYSAPERQAQSVHATISICAEVHPNRGVVMWNNGPRIPATTVALAGSEI